VEEEDQFWTPERLPGIQFLLSTNSSAHLPASTPWIRRNAQAELSGVDFPPLPLPKVNTGTLSKRPRRWLPAADFLTLEVCQDEQDFALEDCF
jgi:hypothetical protein